MAIIGYTKLFNSIVTSTIWSEPNATRIVWITMLASCDRDGFVPASIPGLANLARVSIEECKEAIETLESPDEYSRSQEFEGRRIEKVDGGWRLLNHTKYRKILSEQERREYNSRKQREYRERKKMSPNVTMREQFVTASTHTDSDTDTDTDIREEKPFPPTKPVGVVLGSPEFLKFWDAYPKRVDRKEAVRAWMKGFCDGSLGAILAGLEKWKQTEQWTDPDKIPYPSTWLEKHRWKEVPETGKASTKNEKNRQITKQAVERVRAELGDKT